MNYLIVGAASGIGSEIAKQLLAENHNVYTTFNESPINYTHINLSSVKHNVLDEFDASFLPETLDGIVYCPGKIDLKPFHRIKEAAILDDFQLQVLGAVKVLQKCHPILKKTPQSSVVLFSTVATKIGFNFHAQVAMSKGAIEGLVTSLAAEWAPHTRVNAIAPSITNTPLAAAFLNSDAKITANEERHPLKSIGQAQDIASMATFLLSDKAKWITGQSITIDGGISSIHK